MQAPRKRTASQTVTAESPLLEGGVSSPSLVFYPAAAAAAEPKPILSISLATAPTPTPTPTPTPNPAKLWRIHGQLYDLEPFMAQHPGGAAILRLSQGEPDCTPLFESYHAFANLDSINKQLQRYRVSAAGDGQAAPEGQMYSFEESGFYKTLTHRVRQHFGGDPSSWAYSVNKNVKADRTWAAKIITQVAVFLACWVVALFTPEGVTLAQAVAASALAGIIITGLGMTTFHDASHYAVRERNHAVNGLIMRVWGAVALWDPRMWLYHHTVRHHAFTGDAVFDPDTQHARPFVRKHVDSPRHKYLAVFHGAQRWVMALWAFLVYVLAPGMFVGQVLSYHVIWRFKGHLWKMGTPPADSFDRKWWEAALSLAMLGSHVYKFTQAGWMEGLAVTGTYIVALNLTYALCILPDHDTFESAVENHLSAPTDEHQPKPDWGEVQVRHSSDFGGQGFVGRAFAHMFGSINVQIAHHLFPGVSHVHLPKLVPIIQSTCREFNIPYASHASLSGAVWSFVKTIHHCMAEGDVVDVIVGGEKEE